MIAPNVSGYSSMRAACSEVYKYLSLNLQNSVSAPYVQLKAKKYMYMYLWILNLDAWHHSQGYIPTQNILDEPF